MGEENLSIVGWFIDPNDDGLLHINVGGEEVPLGNADVVGSSATLYDDDWTRSGNATPTTIVNTEDDSTLYDKLQETTTESTNLFAKAYIQPRYGSLTYYSNANEIGGGTVVEDNEVDGVINAGRTSDTAEADDFWVVYVSTAFQGALLESNDPTAPGSNKTFGIATGNGSLIYLETLRDTGNTALIPVVTAHEVGHQFGFAHTDAVSNLMHSKLIPPAPGYPAVSENPFFLPGHIAYLRSRTKSPGK